MSLPSQAIAIWSPYKSGHHPAYLEQILRSVDFASVSCVSVYTPLSSDELFSGFPQLDHLRTFVVEKRIVFRSSSDFSGVHANSLISHLSQGFALFRIILSGSFSLLVIPYSDSIFIFLPIVSLLHSLCNHGSTIAVWMRLKSHLPRLSHSVKLIESIKVFYLFLLSDFCSVRNYSPDVFACSSYFSNYGALLAYLPERVISKCQDPSVSLPFVFSSVPGEINLLVFGDISDRKCIASLMRLAFLCGERLRITTVGKHSPGAKRAFSSARGVSMYNLDQYLPDNLLSNYIAFSDAIWCVQDSHELSSSAAANAIFHHKVLIYNCGYYIVNVAKAYNKSVSLDDLLGGGFELLALFAQMPPILDLARLPCHNHSLYSDDWHGYFSFEKYYA